MCMPSLPHFVSIAVVHAEGAGAAAETITFWPKVLSVAGVAKHLTIVLRDATRVQQLAAVG